MEWEGSIDLPLRIKVKKKFYPLNLNAYRNTYFYTLNQQKVVFTEYVSKSIRAIPKLSSLVLSYKLFPATKRLCDVANICSVVDKFFCDALTKEGIIKDDNYQVIPKVIYEIGEVDTKNPRVTVTIKGKLNEDSTDPV